MSDAPRYSNAAEQFIYGQLPYAQGTDFEKIANRLCNKVIPNLEQSGKVSIDGEVLRQRVNARAKLEQGLITLQTFNSFIEGQITPSELKAYIKAGEMLANQEMTQSTYERVMDGVIDAEEFNAIYEQ